MVLDTSHLGGEPKMKMKKRKGPSNKPGKTMLTKKERRMGRHQ
jgi:hypothetical protein